MSVSKVPLGRVVRAIVLAGLAAAVIEMVFVLPIQVQLGNSPAVVFQSIAFGLLGKAAFNDGMASTALGVGVHLLVSLVAAKVFVLAALFWDDVLLRKPVVSGLVYGAVVYVVMTFVVMPLSAIGYAPQSSLVLIWLSLAVHLFAFGLPIALVSKAVLLSRARAAA